MKNSRKLQLKWLVLRSSFPSKGAIIIVGMLSLALLSGVAMKLPAGEPFKVGATLESVGTSHGRTGTSSVFHLTTDDGLNATVYPPDGTPATIESHVLLRGQKRLLGGTHYDFVRYDRQ